MGRDRMLPPSLVHTTRKTPDYAILFTGGVTLLLSYLFSGKIESISTLVNFGALSLFVVNTYYCLSVQFRMANGAFSPMSFSPSGDDRHRLRLF